MTERGIYPPPSQYEAWFVSAAHSEDDVKATLAAASDSLSA
jgi:glutamate-1-semialdehyde 2,1-aminomutase